MDTAINAHPADAAAAIVRPYVLFNVRYNFLPVVDMQSGGQPGLPGGGLAEILASIERWNGAGSSFAFGLGSTSGPARCYMSQLFNSRVTISFMDPCGEIDDDGGTLAVGGSYYDDDTITIVNGLRFNNATEGFIVNNNSAIALGFLTRSGLFRRRSTTRAGTRPRSRSLARAVGHHVRGDRHELQNNATRALAPTTCRGCWRFIRQTIARRRRQRRRMSL